MIHCNDRGSERYNTRYTIFSVTFSCLWYYVMYRCTLCLRFLPTKCVNNWFIVWFTVCCMWFCLTEVHTYHIRVLCSSWCCTIRFIGDIAITTSLCNYTAVPSNRYRGAHPAVNAQLVKLELEFTSFWLLRDVHCLSSPYASSFSRLSFPVSNFCLTVLFAYTERLFWEQNSI